MRLIIFILLLGAFLQAKESTCYTVQLVSAVSNEKNTQELASLEYAQECKMMNVGNSLAVRCGCYSTIEPAQKKLKAYKKHYKHAYVIRTYAYRFISQKERQKKKSTKMPLAVYHKSHLLHTYTKAYTVDFNQAKKLFMQQKYQEAYNAFYVLFQENLTNPNINFYLGRSAYMLKKYDLAIASYERVLNVDANSIRSRLEIGRSYFAMKNYEKAKEVFLQVASYDIPKNVRKNVNLYLQAIALKQTKHFINGSLILSLNYDSNVYNRANDAIFTLSGIIDSTTNQALQVKNSTKDTSSFSHQEAFSLNYMYSYSDNIRLKNDFVAFNKTTFSAHDLDILLLQYTPAVSVIYKKHYIVDYALLFDKIWVHSNSYMKIYGFYPQIKYIYSPHTLFDGAIAYQQKSTDRLVSRFKTLELGARHIYSDQFDYLFSFKAYQEKKRSGSQTHVDYKQFTLGFTPTYHLNHQLSFTPRIQWYRKTFDAIDPFYLRRQVDKETQLSLHTSYALSAKNILSLDYLYIKHNSNISAWEFKKQTLTANAIFAF